MRKKWKRKRTGWRRNKRWRRGEEEKTRKGEVSDTDR